MSNEKGLGQYRPIDQNREMPDLEETLIKAAEEVGRPHNAIHNKILYQAERIAGQLAKLDIEIHAATVQVLNVMLQARVAEVQKTREREAQFGLQQPPQSYHP